MYNLLKQQPKAAKEKELLTLAALLGALVDDRPLGVVTNECKLPLPSTRTTLGGPAKLISLCS